MLNRVIASLLHLCGKEYQPDPRLPSFYILGICFKRAVWLGYGLLRLQRFSFVSPKMRIENAANLSLGRYATLEENVVINAVASEAVKIGDRTKIGAYSRIIATAHLSQIGKGFSIGVDSGCGEFCYFGAVGGITIGDRVIMGQYVSFHSQEHSFVDTEKAIKHQGTTEKGILVGHDCWIGAKATILDGTIIGNHCVVAAGAVVKGEFPAYSVIGGVPAKIIRELRDAA